MNAISDNVKEVNNKEPLRASSIKERALAVAEEIWLDASIGEKLAKARMIKIERHILAKPEVARQIKVQGLHHLNVLDFSTGKTRTWDQQELQQLKPMVPSVLWPFNSRYKLSAKNLQRYPLEFPESWKLVKSMIERKPSKPSFNFIYGAFVKEAIERSRAPLPETVLALEQAWVEAKSREKQQKKIRLAAEREILSWLDPSSECCCIKLGQIKIKFKQKIQIEQSKLESLRAKIPSDEWLFDEYFVEKKIACKNIQYNIDEVWALFSSVQKSKTKKTYFSIAA